MKSTQYHKTLIMLYSFVLVFLVFLIFLNAHQFPVLSFIFCIVFSLLFILALLYYKLTISVDDDFVAFSLGIGWLKKKYILHDIRNCKPVKEKISIYSRIRFEKLPNGGKAYVLSSSLPSIEITYSKGNNVVCSDRVGTDNPQDISDFINKRIAQSE